MQSSSLLDRGEWVEVSVIMLKFKLVFQQVVLLSISLLCHRWRRQQDTDVTNRTKPKCKQLVMDFHEACHDVTEAGSCYWLVQLQHSWEWMDGDQPLPASSSTQEMQSYPVTDLTRHRTAPQIVRCFFLGWVQWLCASVFSYWKHLERCEEQCLCLCLRLSTHCPLPQDLTSEKLCLPSAGGDCGCTAALQL